MKYKILYIISFSALLFNGCSQKQDSTSTQMPTSRPMVETIPPTIGTTPNAPTQTPVSNNYELNCIPVDSQVLHPNNTGGLILYDPSNKYPSNVALLNISENSIVGLGDTDEHLVSFRVSPNKKWVAFEATKSNANETKLVIQSFSTGKKIELPWHEDWDLFGLERWLNNDTLLIALASQEYPPSFITLNPFTGEITSLPSKFPNQEVLAPPTDITPFEYDPSLRYVLYRTFENQNPGFVLFDGVNNKQIATFPMLNLVDPGSPNWSPDGQLFAFVTETYPGVFIYTGKTDGSVTTVANLGRFSPFFVRSMNWSPNNQYIALIITTLSSQSEKLLIVDLARQKLVDPCIELNYENWWGSYSDSQFPVWSPDGKTLIVENQTDYGKNEVILIDLSKMTAGIFAKDVRVLGWVSMEP